MDYSISWYQLKGRWNLDSSIADSRFYKGEWVPYRYITSTSLPVWPLRVIWIWEFVALRRSLHACSNAVVFPAVDNLQCLASFCRDDKRDGDFRRARDFMGIRWVRRVRGLRAANRADNRDFRGVMGVRRVRSLRAANRVNKRYDHLSDQYSPKSSFRC